jgi:hypothetical protein
LENLSNLVNSPPDAYSGLSGFELVEKKVKELVVMGGGYPSGHEYNFWADNPLATAHVVNSWPGTVQVTFLGTEIGEKVRSDARLSTEAPADDPVGRAYTWFIGFNTSRESWDPLTMLYAWQGLGEWFEYAGIGGYNHVWPNGSNSWRENGRKRKHRYLKLKAGNESLGRELDELYLEGADMYKRK